MYIDDDVVLMLMLMLAMISDHVVLCYVLVTDDE
jgi:hypothetical protein